MLITTVTKTDIKYLSGDKLEYKGKTWLVISRFDNDITLHRETVFQRKYKTGLIGNVYKTYTVRLRVIK